MTIINPEKRKIAVVIPMYRVEQYIGRVIERIPAWVDRIIAVDDCSPDGSGEAAVAVGDARLVLMRLPQNRGVGGAVMAGFQRAIDLGADILVKMDGDGQMDPSYLPALVQPILDEKADFTKGNRFVHIREIKSMPGNRRAGNLGLSFLAKATSGYWNVFDPTNGYLAIAAQVYKLLDPESIHSRYYFEINLLCEMHLIRAVVVDVPIPARYLGESSSLSIRRTLFEFPPLLLKSLLRRIWIEYFVLDFTLGSLFLVVGIPMIIFGVLWGAAGWIHSIRVNVAATTGTVMIAVLPIILGFQLVLQSFVFDIQNIPSKIRNQWK